MASLGPNELTIRLLKPECSCIIRLLPSLQITWFLVSPDHQQSWYIVYWGYRIHESLSSMWKDVNHLHAISVKRNYWKYWYILKEKETQHSFAGLLNIYISGIWLWYMQALFINGVKQNRCLKSENPQPMVVTILPPCSGKQMWMWCSVVSSLLDGS